MRAYGPLGFITRLELVRPDGVEVEWTSRRHRKLLGLSARGVPARERRRRPPTAMSCWLATLFGVGSACFAAGSIPLFVDHVDAHVLAWTFAVGSVFFTGAAFLQFHETVTAPQELLAAPRRRRLSGLVRWRPRRVDWWAAATQLAGTVFFNVSTFAATRTDLSFDRAQRLVWGPDVAGSVCFLLAGWLAYAEVNKGVLPRSDRTVGWRIAALNLIGAIAFGASAVGARLLPTTGEPVDVALVNAGTFLGAVCFLFGAVLLPVESSRDATATAAPSRS
ncbi:hypothetical protein [Nocardioides insulae]|uniref:hypothetical protein n=1 Tax=Nocardioides insulae TaxID=394734 RepID=UPI00041FB45B|nr:hypothetical protein [Nocardioides insulae]